MEFLQWAKSEVEIDNMDEKAQRSQKATKVAVEIAVYRQVIVVNFLWVMVFLKTEIR